MTVVGGGESERATESRGSVREATQDPNTRHQIRTPYQPRPRPSPNLIHVPPPPPFPSTPSTPSTPFTTHSTVSTRSSSPQTAQKRAHCRPLSSLNPPGQIFVVLSEQDVCLSKRKTAPRRHPGTEQGQLLRRPARQGGMSSSPDPCLTSLPNRSAHTTLFASSWHF